MVCNISTCDRSGFICTYTRVCASDTGKAGKPMHATIRTRWLGVRCDRWHVHDTNDGLLQHGEKQVLHILHEHNTGTFFSGHKSTGAYHQPHASEWHAKQSMLRPARTGSARLIKSVKGFKAAIIASASSGTNGGGRW